MRHIDCESKCLNNISCEIVHPLLQRVWTEHLSVQSYAILRTPLDINASTVQTLSQHSQVLGDQTRMNHTARENRQNMPSPNSAKHARPKIQSHKLNANVVTLTYALNN